MIIYILAWEEYESGWGSRPDGLQVFTSSRVMLDVLEKNRVERASSKSTPREYSIPIVRYVCDIDENEFKVLFNSKKIRSEKSYWLNYPGKRDVDYLKKTCPSFEIISTERLLNGT